MNRHSRLLGNDAWNPEGHSWRGQRVFCSNRGKRGGCGRTYALLIGTILPGRTMTASVLWQWLKRMASGQTHRQAALGLPFALETFRALKVRLEAVLERIRTRLWIEAPPPESKQESPLLQSIEHLQNVFPASECPIADFQIRFQVSFLN